MALSALTFFPRVEASLGCNLCGLRALTVDDADSGRRATSLRCAGRVRDELRPCLACETFPQACQAVASGRYAALLSVLARASLQRVQVVEMPLPAIGAKGGTVHLVWHPRTERTRPSASRVIDLLAKDRALGAAGAA